MKMALRDQSGTDDASGNDIIGYQTYVRIEGPLRWALGGRLRARLVVGVGKELKSPLLADCPPIEPHPRSSEIASASFSLEEQAAT